MENHKQSRIGPQSHPKNIPVYKRGIPPLKKPTHKWPLIEDVINALNKGKDNSETLAEIGRDFGITYEGDYEAFNTAVVTKAREIL